ncbi:MAG: bacterial Ig-like domain-containing protein, partial [Streptococcaceae bacterium]|nr:bacterial Ig-like domain-containing protein [Streptococcaceae bacterium]
ATGSISVTNQTVANGTAFKPSSLLVSATDSNGSTVDLSTVTYTGTVIPTHSGTYAIQFSFTDSDGSTVTQTALWTVQAKGTASAANIAEAVVTNKTTGSESLKVTNTTLVVGQAYRAASAFVSATDSEGNAVPASAITVAGTVVSSKAGVYPVVYSFTDPYTGDVVSQTALVTVTPATKVVTA